MQAEVMSQPVIQEFTASDADSSDIDGWFLSSPPVIASILLTYLSFVLFVGPAYMKSRPPFKLNKLIFIYNVVQVFVSVYLIKLGLHFLWTDGLFLNKGCSFSKAIVVGLHAYLLAKISELLDTVFFVLRKKQSQVTFLHVYHHTSTVTYTWLFLKYEPTATLTFLGTLNSFVHVIMYSYYALSTFPGLRKYLGWKKYITKLQLVQFAAIIGQISLNYFTSDCNLNYSFYVVIVNGFLFLYLFGKFYKESYTKQKNVKEPIVAPARDGDGKIKTSSYSDFNQKTDDICLTKSR